MLKKFLSSETCAQCRICCGFDDEDLWEVPVVSPELKAELEKEYPHIEYVPYENSYKFNMIKSPDGLYYCPMLSEKGCILKDSKPFDCKIWPFRVMSLNGSLVITLSPVCPSLSAKPLNELHAFLADGFAERLFREAKVHPDIVKDYLTDYPILAVQK